MSMESSPEMGTGIAATVRLLDSLAARVEGLEDPKWLSFKLDRQRLFCDDPILIEDSADIAVLLHVLVDIAIASASTFCVDRTAAQFYVRALAQTRMQYITGG